MENSVLRGWGEAAKETEEQPCSRRAERVQGPQGQWSMCDEERPSLSACPQGQAHPKWKSCLSLTQGLGGRS